MGYGGGSKQRLAPTMMRGTKPWPWAGGIGALVWGVAADFFPVRWLIIALAALCSAGRGMGLAV